MLADCAYKNAEEIPPSEAPTRMIDSVEIKNFKCFTHLQLDGLGLINVIVGDNASGKTALLEALFASQTGGPEVALRFRNWRGLGRELAFLLSRSSYESLWRDLFYGMNQDLTIEIHSRGNSEQTRSLRIFYGGPAITPDSPSEKQKTLGMEVKISADQADLSVISPITFEHTGPHGDVVTYQPAGEGGNIVWRTKGNPLPGPASFYSSSAPAVNAPSEIAGQFSELSKIKKSREFTKRMRKLYPQIVDLSTEPDNGVNQLFCEIAALPRKVPIGFVSSGIQKLASILLGIASNPRGSVFVDEIENGIYYEKLGRVWLALWNFCREYGVQIFASTHSRECLQAILPAIEKEPNDFRLIRVEKGKTGSDAKMFQGKDFESAVMDGAEIR